MAKSLKEQLASLVGGKKPNVFYKGLNLDTDPHVVSNEQYTDALNVRLNNKDNDFGTLQNLPSMKEAGKFGLSGWKFVSTPEVPTNPSFPNGPFYKWFLPDGYDSSDAGIAGIKFIFSDNASNTILTITVPTNIATFSEGLTFDPVAVQNSNRTMMLHCYEYLRNDTTFTDLFHVAIENNITKAQAPNLYFFIKNSQSVAGNIQVFWVKPDGNELNVASLTSGSSLQTWSSQVYGLGGFPMYPVALVSFSNYIAAVCYNSTLTNIVAKIRTQDNGNITSIEPVVIGDFGVTDATASIQIEKIEENENFNRIYWTDGINPIKTVNLEASASFYNDFESSDDFNLFSKSPLKPIEIKSVQDGGTVNCGSWSYCYRLVTKDGKFSVVSPITNPISLPKGSTATDYHLIQGGNIGENSGKSVSMLISGVSRVYNKVQLIGIQYSDELGGAFYFLLKEEAIDTDTIRLVHNGNEVTQTLTASEVLISRNTWDVAQTIAVKDNRLLAANLKNTSSDIVDDLNAFRVKSFKHSVGGNGNFDTAPSSGEYSTHDDLNNPDLYDDVLYKYSHSDTTKYRYAEGVPNGSGDSHTTNNSKLMFGASTPGYHESGDINGVYVTFKLAQIDLNEVNYWDQFGGTNFSSAFNANTVYNEGHHEAPYYGPKARRKVRPDYIGFRNYKDPIINTDKVGYMRDEIYRFGIQFYDRSGNQTFTYPIGDLRFPPIESDYRYLGTVEGNYEPIAGVINTASPLKYVLCNEAGQGFILYPEFRIKLKQSIKDNISGFSIVRAERTDSDKRVLTAGLLNQTLFHRNTSRNGNLSNKIGCDKVALFTQDTGDASFGDTDDSEFYTLDSPDIMFGYFNYTTSGTDKIRVATKFFPKSWDKESRPSFTATNANTSDNNIFDDDDGGTHTINWYADDLDNTIYYACPVYPDYSVTPDLGDVRKLSLFSMYYCDELANSELTDPSLINDQQLTIFYGQKVGPNETVSATNYSDFHNQDFLNACLLYDMGDNMASIDLNGSTYIDRDEGKIMHGNTTLFLAIDQGARFDTSISGNVGFGHNPLRGGNYNAEKMYGKIINPVTASSGIYGGNTQSNFEKTRWISTGASVHGDEISAGQGVETIVSVFGGDTYVNMFSLSKFHKPDYNTDSSYRAVQCPIFPVESSVNIDMREGNFFGRLQPNLMEEDDYICQPTYLATNNTKTFPAKDRTIKLINNFKNLIAVSNTKIAGQQDDAFSKFDSAEIFEVNHNYGGISNLITFKDQLYALQENAVSIVSINTRALIQAEDGSSISIQSFIGTGTVIERNDYISTKHGSQHRMNGLATDNGLYFWDKYLSTICKIDIKSPNQVIDLLQLKNCTTALNVFRFLEVNDNPLNVTTSSGGKLGGVSISYNPFYGEVVFTATYYIQGDYMNMTSIAYDELLDVFTSKRGYANMLPVAHRGRLYSIGFPNNFAGVTETDVLRQTIYIDSEGTGYNKFYGVEATDAPLFEFVYNQDSSDTKIFDKISIKSSHGGDNLKMITFGTDANNTSNTINLLTSDIGSGIPNKNIIPVFAGEENGRFKGSYLTVLVQQNHNKFSEPFSVFSVTTHSRKIIL